MIHDIYYLQQENDPVPLAFYKMKRNRKSTKDNKQYSYHFPMTSAGIEFDWFFEIDLLP